MQPHFFFPSNSIQLVSSEPGRAKCSYVRGDRGAVHSRSWLINFIVSLVYQLPTPMLDFVKRKTFIQRTALVVHRPLTGTPLVPLVDLPATEA